MCMSDYFLDRHKVKNMFVCVEEFVYKRRCILVDDRFVFDIIDFLCGTARAT